MHGVSLCCLQMLWNLDVTSKWVGEVYSVRLVLCMRSAELLGWDRRRSGPVIGQLGCSATGRHSLCTVLC